MKLSVIRSAAVAALAMPLLVGCYIGPDAATQVQGNSGNGATVAVPGMEIVNATLVAGDPDSGKAAFLGTLYNPTDEDDEVRAITADGEEAQLTPGTVPVPAGGAVTITTGSDAEAAFSSVVVEAGSYVPVTVVFANAGQASFNALLVPPTGFYADAAPAGTRAVDQEGEEPAAGAEERSAESATEGETGAESGAEGESATEQDAEESGAGESGAEESGAEGEAGGNPEPEATAGSATSE